MTLAQELKALDKLKTEAAKADRRAKELKQELQLMQHRVYQRMEAEEVPLMAVGNYTFSPMSTAHAVVQDPQAFAAWDKEENDGLMTAEKPVMKFLNEEVRMRLRSGRPLPPGVGFYSRETISRRSRKAKS